MMAASTSPHDGLYSIHPLAPRQGSAPRSLYLASSTSEQTRVAAFAAGTHIPPMPSSNVNPDGTKFKEHLSFDNVPLTPGRQPDVGMDRSHFSPPTTPVMELGVRRNDEKRSSFANRVSRAFVWSASAPNASCTCGRRRMRIMDWIWRAVVAIVLLFLFINVIYLDIRVANMNHSLEGVSKLSVMNASSPPPPTPPMASDVSLSSTSHVASPSLAPLSSLAVPSPSPTPSLSQHPPSLDSIPEHAVECISRFQQSGGPLPDATSYCTRCVPALIELPWTWFLKEVQKGDEESMAIIKAAASAAEFCDKAAVQMEADVPSHTRRAARTRTSPSPRAGHSRGTLYYVGSLLGGAAAFSEQY